MGDKAAQQRRTAGALYDGFMGRWTRAVAPHFLDSLKMATGLHWIDLGAGTGALAGTILDAHDPAHVVALERVPHLVAHMRDLLPDPRLHGVVGDALAIPLPPDCVDAAVSGLLLAQVPDKNKALFEMARVVRPGGTVAFFVWDYPAGGLGFIHAFWQAATAIDPDAEHKDEAHRFAFCRPQALTVMARSARLRDVTVEPIEITTVFADFEDYWLPLRFGAGAAPDYYRGLPSGTQDALMTRLRDTLPVAANGSITLTGRAWVVRGTV